MIRALLLAAGVTVPGEQAYLAFFTYVIHAVAGDTPDRQPEPVSDICDECNGKGWVGDGTIRDTCTVCGGTGRISRYETWPGQSADLAIPTPPMPQKVKR